MRFTTVLTFVMLAIFSTMVLTAIRYPAGARLMPLVVGIPGILLCLVQIALDIRQDRRVGSGAQATEDDDRPDRVGRELAMWGYFLAFIAGLLMLGFWISVPAMLIVFLRNEAKASWTKVLTLTVLATGTLYLVFAVTLQVRLFPGFLTPVVGRWLGF